MSGPAHLPSMARANERGLFVSFYVSRAEIRTLERPAHVLSPVRANERGPFVEFFYCATGRNQHLGPRSFALTGDGK